MHTLMRFLGETEQPNSLRQVADELDRVAPGLFVGLDRIPGRFSCELCDTDDWFDHRNAILDFVRKGASVLNFASNLDVLVRFDISIWPEDRHGRNLTCFVVDKEVIAALAPVGAEIEFSYYLVK